MLQTRSDFPSHCFNVNPMFSHCFARTTPIEPSCFEGWNKFSVPVRRAWLSYWTLIKEQPQSRQNPVPREKEHFSFARLSFPTLFSHAPTSRNAIQHISTFAVKTDWYVSFSANGISLRPGEVEMKILQSWRQALLTSPLPQSSRCSRQISRETQINLAQNKCRVRPKWRACSQAKLH